MPYEKNRKRDSDTERRIYYADDALPLFLITVMDPSRSRRVTSYGLRHRFGVTLIVSRHSERWQEFCVRKTGNRTVTQSEESMILMTSYRFPHHGNRSFAIASG